MCGREDYDGPGFFFSSINKEIVPFLYSEILVLFFFFFFFAIQLLSKWNDTVTGNYVYCLLHTEGAVMAKR